ncbi:MAG: HAD family hydrolase [Bryobacteraceae bacterium]
MRVSPSTVIFDYGNVLSQPQPIADTQAMADILDLPLAPFTELYWRFRVPYDAGTLTPADYWDTVAQTASRVVTADQTSSLIEIDSRSWSHPAPGMPQWASRLRAAGLRTAILSNMPAPVRDYVLRCSWLPHFDARVFSCEAGVCKPAPEIYHDCLTKLGAQPSEVLFLDDRESNVRAAEALGLHAVLFMNPSAAAQEIRQRFSLPITPE